MQSPRRIKRAKRRGRWDNSPAGIRRRLAQQDARREAIAATLPPVDPSPQPGELWQTITVTLYVPTSGRCDQHAVMIDGQRVGLLSATQVAEKVRGMIRKRPSVALQADVRREEWLGAVAEFRI